MNNSDGNQNKTMGRNKKSNFILLYGVFLIYSLAGVFSKLASQKNFLSLEFIILYGGSIVILFIYAVLWQNILKKFPLNVAYSNKAIVVIYGQMWGTLLFKETITLTKMLGIMIIILGIYVIVNEQDDSNKVEKE